jgi:hypothetical protein
MRRNPYPLRKVTAYRLLASRGVPDYLCELSCGHVGRFKRRRPPRMLRCYHCPPTVQHELMEEARP